MKKILALLVTVVVLVQVSGCAAMLHGTSDQITVQSPDAETSIYMDDVLIGKGSAKAYVKRNTTHTLTAKKNGCTNYQVETQKAFDGVSLLGVLIDWGLISILVVDWAVTGAIWKTEPTYYHVAPVCESNEPQTASKQPQAHSETPTAPPVPTADKEGAKAPNATWLQDIEQFKPGVVKITARSSQGLQKIGTGFIVRLEKDIAYIITSAHVIAGDSQPALEFFTKRNVPVYSTVLGIEGDNELRGLALLAVRGQENLPSGLAALPLASSVPLGGGQDVVVIGFPRSAGSWAVSKGTIASRQGRIVNIGAPLDEGNSGGPLIHNGKVIGMVAGSSQSFSQGITTFSVVDYLDGFGIWTQYAATR
jgi:S1-C subfamily serine protease